MKAEAEKKEHQKMKWKPEILLNPTAMIRSQVLI